MYIIIIIFIVISIVKLLTSKRNKLEHLTQQSDEAIQNLASLYNKDKLTIGSMEITGPMTAATGNISTINSVTGNITNGNITNIKTNKIQLGDKWLFSGVGDAYANDDWLRLYKTNGSADYYGGVAMGKLYVNGPAYVQGDLNLSGTVQGNFNLGGKVTKIYPNTRGPDGWDIWDGFPGDFQACINTCKGYRNATTAQHQKSDNHCWCKSLPALNPTRDTNEHDRWNTAIFM